MRGKLTQPMNEHLVCRIWGTMVPARLNKERKKALTHQS